MAIRTWPTPPSVGRISVLFVDLVDFTALAEWLDPEEVRTIQSRYFEVAADRLSATLRRDDREVHWRRSRCGLVEHRRLTRMTPRGRCELRWRWWMASAVSAPSPRAGPWSPAAR